LGANKNTRAGARQRIHHRTSPAVRQNMCRGLPAPLCAGCAGCQPQSDMAAAAGHTSRSSTTPTTFPRSETKRPRSPSMAADPANAATMAQEQPHSHAHWTWCGMLLRGPLAPGASPRDALAPPAPPAPAASAATPVRLLTVAAAMCTLPRYFGPSLSIGASGCRCQRYIHGIHAMTAPKLNTHSAARYACPHDGAVLGAVRLADQCVWA